MERHDADRVVVGLGQQWFGHPRALTALKRGPVEKRPQVPTADIRETAGLVDEEPHAPPCVARPPMRERERKDVAGTDDLFEQRARLAPAGGFVPARERRHGLGHCSADAGNGNRGPVIPRTARLNPGEQVAVVACEHRATQSGDRGQLVGGIVDRGHDRQQVANLRRVEHQRARVDAVRHVALGERGLEHGQRLARRDQHGDVGTGRVAPRAKAVATHLPHRTARRIVTDGVDDGRDIGRLTFAQRRRVGIVVVARAEQAHLMIGRFGRAARGRQRAVARLAGAFDGHERAEHRVHPRDDGLDSAKVRDERDMRGGTEHLASTLEQRDIGATKTIDRLLRIAHDEHPTRRSRERRPLIRRVDAAGVGRARDEHCQLDLDRVGVLELVEQQPRVALVQRSTSEIAGAQQSARQHEQIVELELATVAARMRSRERELAQHDEPHCQNVVDGTLAQHGGRRVERNQRGTGRVDVGPVGFLPRPAGCPAAVVREQAHQKVVIGGIGVAQFTQLGGDRDEVAQ